MLVIPLPSPIQQILPLLKQLNPEQKIAVVREILTEENTSDLAKKNENLAWEMGKDIFGSYASGRNDLSIQAKSLVKQKIRQKHGKNSD